MLTKLEIKRQLFHVTLGVSIVLLLYFNIINEITLLIILLIGIILSFLSLNHKIPLITKLLRKFDRKKDLKTLPGRGAIFYIMGSFLSAVLFPKTIAMASILILAFGDSVSRLVGPYGYLKHPFHNEKFLEGVIAGGTAAFLASLVFIEWLPALIASVAAMLIEGIDLEIKNFKVDDNLTIPLVSGFIIWAFYLFI